MGGDTAVRDAAHDFEVEAERDEDHERARGRTGDVEERREVGGDVHGLGEVGELLEGITQEDERQDFKLLAHGTREGARDAHDELEHLDRQDESEGQLNGGKMARWRDGREGSRHEACPPCLDEGEGEKIDPEEDAGEAPL